MRRGLYCGLLVAMILMAGIVGQDVQAADKVYVNGIDANFPPFSYIDKDGKPAGFDVEALEWIAKEMGFKVEHKAIDWDAIIPSLTARKIDVIASGLSVTEERKKQIAFTNPYWEIKQVLVVKKDANLTVDQVLNSDQKVGLQRGTSEAKWMKENLIDKGKKFELVYYDSGPLAAEDVLNGRIIAAAMDDAPAHEVVREKPLKILGTFGMPEETFAYGVRKEDTELLKVLNEGLEKFMKSPKFQELKEKYQL
ncbi:ABC transporter substrate-binding protein [Desulfosoma caldarium]|uniref:Amino acid ABC transporter substrate-binding protein (PAAT family) n=1 Tax=Desulfosoma caldarium TaxID=610254 RepID=A0A3N1UM59_9BACT|nr:ABC transporter substrate-binding protein [Desulfosoma caldarium]ROQ92292.1 amino acid ABC transporter substrate-binding protein (PAAT family) [Desulfosoma caldarium]